MVLEILSFWIGECVSGSNWKLQVSSLVKLWILSKCSSFVAYCWDFLLFLYSYFIVQSSKWPLRKHLPPCHSPAVPRQTDRSLLVVTCFCTYLYNIMKMSVAFFSSFIKRIHSIPCLTLRRLMSCIYGAPILDVSRSHTMTQHSR